MSEKSGGTAKSHLVLARRYRPQFFSDVVEQPLVVTALKNAIKNQRLGSAYLFFGPRGVGKTTIARILAKRVNCMSPVEEDSCDECNSCKSILSGHSMDVLEIDAASHRGIDHIRELRENVKFPPMVSHKKVYIIDEVHMLTTESFNALLKTLEEPPAHILFVLATTELNKLPETILSRCQVFNFRKVAIKIVQAYLRQLIEKENIKADDESLFWIARRGDGSIRDSLSFLEQAITYCDSNLDVERVKQLIGITPASLFEDLSTALLDPQIKREALLEPVQEAFTRGLDLNSFIWDYLDFLRNLSHIGSGVSDPEFLSMPEQEIHHLKKKYSYADKGKLDLIFQNIYALLSRSVQLKLSNSYETRILIEMELVSLSIKLSRPSISGVLQKLNQLSATLEGGAPYSPEHEIQKQFLGTVVDANAVPDLEKKNESI